jgi:hypothetical protein
MALLLENPKKINFLYLPLHSGSSLAIIFFYFFLVLYDGFSLADNVFEGKKNIFPIKWGKLVYGEVREFFQQKLIFPVLCTVLAVFRP